ncbi:transaldolase [Pseudomonas sp. Marseille-QA0892]
MPTLLEQLKRHTLVVADTGELEAIERFRPEDATTNPSLVLKAIQAGHYPEQVDQVLAWAKESSGSSSEAVQKACDRLAVLMGAEILKRVPGKVSTEVPAALSFDTDATLAKAEELIEHYKAAGVDTDRVLIKIAATWEGIQAARILESRGIKCNLTLIFNMAQARACAEAGAFLISPFVGRILDWYVKQDASRTYSGEEEPGVKSVSAIHAFFKRHEYPTIVMGASFRNVDEIIALTGCDRLTISPALLQELESRDGELAVRLKDDGQREPRPAALTEAQFRWQMNEDPMATEKLAEGIRTFNADQVKLEKMIAERLGV